MALRFCTKHPGQQMTELFSSYVCDVCDPPKGVVQPAIEKSKRHWFVAEYKDGFCIVCARSGKPVGFVSHHECWTALTMDEKKAAFKASGVV